MAPRKLLIVFLAATTLEPVSFREAPSTLSGSGSPIHLGVNAARAFISHGQKFMYSDARMG